MRDPTPLSSAHGPRFLPWAVLLLLALVASLPLHAGTVEPGIVVMTTSPSEATKWQISLGPGFFGPGSDPLTDLEITFRGEPLITAPGTPSLALGDTVFEILEEAELEACSGSDTVAIRTVALNLMGTQPVTVTYGGADPELWDVRACLSPTPQLNGWITLTQYCQWGGPFKAALTVRPKIIFERRGDTTERILDPGTTGFIGYQASGYWTKRGVPNLAIADYLEVEPGAVIDADLDGVLEPPLPGTSDVVLGLEPVACACFFSPSYLVVRPVVQEIHQIHVVEPATRDSASFPLYEPGKNLPQDHGGRRGGAATELAALAVLSLGAVFIPLRRK